jgi:hypothetical protein
MTRWVRRLILRQTLESRDCGLDEEDEDAMRQSKLSGSRIAGDPDAERDRPGGCRGVQPARHQLGAPHAWRSPYAELALDCAAIKEVVARM